jgi:hypothetical protein
VANHRTYDPDSTPAAPAYPGLHVDLNGIDDFVAALRKEVEGNLQPHIDHLLRSYEMGVAFGLTSYSENMAATQKVYHECLSRISNLLAGYVAAGQVLAAAAEQVARDHRHTDAMAAANTQSVSDAITAQVQASQNAIAAQETHLDGRDRRYREIW